MPRIAVLQDGTELSRQTDADITGCFEACRELLSQDGTAYELEVFTDEAASSLLARVADADYDCLVFTSNALNAGAIAAAVGERHPDLRRYLDDGGGVVVLHQVCQSLSPLLPDDLCPQLVERHSARGSACAKAYDDDDVLLHYPAPVAIARFADGGLGVGPPSLFYRALDPATLPAKLKPVLLYGDEVLVARTYDHVAERIVVATLPLDWQRATELLANALRFASRGLPRRLVWFRPDQARRRRLLLHWLSLDGTSSLRPIPDEEADLSMIDAWLLRHVDVLLVPPARLEAVRSRPEISWFVENGGTLVAPDDTSETAGGMPSSRVTAVIGGYTERRLARRLYAELRAVRGWDATDRAFELRNIVTALAFLWSNPANRTEAAVSMQELAPLVPELRKRLSNPQDREDLSSSIANVQSLAFICGDEPVPADLVDWMAEDERRKRADVNLQIEAVLAIATRRAAPDFARAAASALSRPGLSLASVVRVMDAIAVMDQAGMLDCDADVTRQLTERTCALLEQNPCEPNLGWLSIEATADVTRGLVALMHRLAPDDVELTARAFDRLGSAVVVLRQSFPKDVDGRLAVASLARLTHAVVLVDRYYPIGLQRLASIDWPDTTLNPAVVASGERSLLDRLTLENKALRDEAIELRESRLAARVGRGAATLGSVALVAVPLAFVLVLIGFASIWTLLANITVILTVLLAVISGLFTVLERRRLLAGPAIRIKVWVERTVPVLGDLSKLKPK
jgi:hypothetical protein